MDLAEALGRRPVEGLAAQLVVQRGRRRRQLLLRGLVLRLVSVILHEEVLIVASDIIPCILL